MARKKKRKGLTLKGPLKRWLLAALTALLVSFYGWMADSVTAVRFPDANTPSLLYSTETRDDLGLAMSRAIKQAKNSVTLIIYTLTDKAIINSLKQKSLEGCNVKVICDAKTSPDIDEILGPSVKVVKRFINGLMHQKILIIDDQQTWIGSANMTPASLRHHNNLVAAIDSPAIAHAAMEKATSYTASERLPVRGHQTFTVGGQKLELCFLPDDQGAVNRIKKLIDTAQKTVRVAMFTWTRNDLTRAVIDAKKRGVDVKVAIDSSCAAGSGVKVVEMLKKGGVRVKCNRGNGLLHHKFLYVDGETLVNGSANWTQAAFEKNDDCFVILHHLNEEQRQFMDNLWQIIESETEFQ